MLELPIRPARDETNEYYFNYIDLVPGDDALSVLEAQSRETPAFLQTISEEQSLYRYAPGKWSVREAWSHVNDTERVFLYRAFWFARGFGDALPSFDQDACAGVAQADQRSWASHIDEFRAIRQSTLAFFRELPAEAWTRGGIASGFPFTVRAIAFILAGHLMHHVNILREKYLNGS